MPVSLQAATAAPTPEPQTRTRALGVAALDRLADLARLVGVVDPHRVGVGAEVDHVVPGERLEHRVAQVDAAVVERDRDLHRTSTRAILPSSNVKRSGSIRPSACTMRDRVAVVPHLDRLELHRRQLALDAEPRRDKRRRTALHRLGLLHATRSSRAAARATTLSRL